MDADAEPTASTSAPTPARAVVQAGVTLMVGLPTRQSHKVIVPANCTRETTTLVHLPKVGAVQLGQLVGKRYGLGYNVLADGTLEEMDKDVVVAPGACSSGSGTHCCLCSCSDAAGVPTTCRATLTLHRGHGRDERVDRQFAFGTGAVDG